jgi:hypothetical protein
MEVAFVLITDMFRAGRRVFGVLILIAAIRRSNLVYAGDFTAASGFQATGSG